MKGKEELRINWIKMDEKIQQVGRSTGGLRGVGGSRRMGRSLTEGGE